MGPVVRLSRYRVGEPAPLDLRAGDADLRAVVVVLWVGSAIRVVLELAAGRPFGVEATLALACVIGLPWSIFSPGNSRNIELIQRPVRSVKKA
jgi:hypothetical protein